MKLISGIDKDKSSGLYSPSKPIKLKLDYLHKYKKLVEKMKYYLFNILNANSDERYSRKLTFSNVNKTIVNVIFHNRGAHKESVATKQTNLFYVSNLSGYLRTSVTLQTD